MIIEYIFRPKGNAFSIEKVFGSVTKALLKYTNITILHSEAKKFKLWPITLIYNMIRYGMKSRKNRIFHITGDVQYLGCIMRAKNTVMTIHDLVPLHDKSVPWYTKKICYWLWYYIPLKRLKYITCISETTKQDLLNYFPWASDKIFVVPNPVDNIFSYSPKKMNTDCPTILHIGTKTNKNLDRVVKALKGIKCHLRIIGRLTQYQQALLDASGVNYSNAFGLSDEQLVQEYVNADIISFPSLFEGFGMPIIEGQTVGRPVLTSNIEPMNIVAGDGALLVNPTNVDDIANAFRTLCSDESVRDSLVAKGIINADNYTADAVAIRYSKIYTLFFN